MLKGTTSRQLTVVTFQARVHDSKHRVEYLILGAGSVKHTIKGKDLGRFVRDLGV
jgi:hypothetical protein